MRIRIWYVAWYKYVYGTEHAQHVVIVHVVYCWTNLCVYIKFETNVVNGLLKWLVGSIMHLIIENPKMN